jgi:protein phosphatase
MLGTCERVSRQVPDNIAVRAGTLVVLCGISGSGKSTFAERNFTTTEVVSSDQCRALLTDNPSNQWVSGSAFRLMHWIIAERLRFHRTTVVDSTALDRRFRRDMLKLATSYKARTLLLVFDTGHEASVKRDAERPRSVGVDVVARQYAKFLNALEETRGEPWDEMRVLTTETLNETAIVRLLGSFDYRHLRGPFDIIGDVHGCMDELLELLDKLGYERDAAGRMSHPDGRRLIFLGDLADRGPRNAAVIELVMSLVDQNVALYTPGNHCNMLMRYLRGTKKRLDWGLDRTVAELEEQEISDPGLKDRVRRFIEDAPTYLWLDDGALIVAHGGIKEDMIGKENGKVRAMVLYGDVTGETNPDGTPVRLDWAKDYQGLPAIVYGHTPVPGPVWRNNTINIDQGCVFGGWLSAVRWPEHDVVQVHAHRAYFTERTPAFLKHEGQQAIGDS